MDLRWLGVNKSSVNKSFKCGESVQAQRNRIVGIRASSTYKNCLGGSIPLFLHKFFVKRYWDPPTPRSFAHTYDA